VRAFGTSIIRASSIVCPPGKCSSSVLPISSSGPRARSSLSELFASRDRIFRITSGESMDLPREFLYFCRMASRTLSTRSSSLTSTRVADAPGLFTHIFLSMAHSGACLIVIAGIGGTGGGGVEGWMGVGAGLVSARVEEVSLRRDRDLERLRSLEPMTEPLRLRSRGILILSNPIVAHFFPHATHLRREVSQRTA
jgi:hypothetical protein